MKARISRTNWAPVAAFLGASMCMAMHVRPAQACGGCFHPPPQPSEVESVITDHRMVFSISTTQTVLWDQVRYSGDPGEFAWVLPIHPGAKIELSHDAWLAALDASTQSVITGPSRTCNNGSTVSYGGGGGGGGGGGCGGSSTSASFADPAPQSAGFVDAGFMGDDHVTVVNQDVVGPYETVTLRSADGEALDAWLVKNGFDIPDAVRPTVDAYASEGFDFIALKMRPGAGIRAMQPVRIVTPGADPTLPLRMVAAGIGSHVGLTLYVISEGRYHPQSFPDAKIDFTKLTWNQAGARSNFQELTMAAMQSGDGRGWITEYAGRPVTTSSSFGNTYGATNPPLYDAYKSGCQNQPPVRVPCDTPAVDAGSHDAALADSGLTADASDASDAASLTDGADASDDASGDASHDASKEASADGAPPPPNDDAGGCYRYIDACSTYDDLDVALKGLHASDVFLTRMRAFLPAKALSAGDLRLGAEPTQALVSNLHHTDKFSDATFDPCAAAGGTPRPYAPSSSEGCVCTTPRTARAQLGTFFALGAVSLLGLTIVRRRRR